MAVYDDGAVPFSQRAGSFVNYAGAACSFALMVGLGFWGYELIKRDVSGIPVVRAIEGDMRVAPANPGGDVALHTGLSVNAVPAEGEAAGFEDTLLLAPQTQQLAQEDLEVQPSAEAGEVAPTDATTAEVAVALTDDEPLAVAEPLSADDVLALADQLAIGAAPLSDLAEEPTAPVLEIIPASIAGVSSSLRPFVRPAELVVTPNAIDDAVAAALASASSNSGPNNSEVTVMTADLPEGTKLVQLGAFPTPQDAADAWGAMQSKFGDYMASKERVIQVATRGESTFYRLRAMGFNDLTDARRFCAALEAGDADCIPVVVR